MLLLLFANAPYETQSQYLLPPSFALDQEGHLFVAFGDRAVQRWDGISANFVEAGVPAPTTTPTIASSGTGTIVGSLYCCTRFLDSAGRVSNISPVSAVHTPAALNGSVTAATNAAPIVITSNSHGLSDGQIVKISGVLGNTGANGVWTVQNKTSNTFELASSQGNGTYTTGGTWRSGAGTINYTNVQTTTDSRVVKRQILRNKDGDARTFYIDVEDTTLTGTSFNSTNADSALTSAVAVPLVDSNNNDLAVVRHSPPPNYKRFIVHHRGRMWLAGQMRYRDGSVVLTPNSTTVTGLATQWTSAMAGWQFWPENSTRSYAVSSVDVGAQTLTLSTAYVGSAEAYANYALTPPIYNSAGGAERRTIYFSEAGLSNSWDLTKSLTVQEEKEAGEITGLISYNNSLLIAFERKLMRLSYATRPNLDGQAFTALYRGLVNQNCRVEADGLMYLMDRRGVYIFAGSQDDDISAAIRPMFDGTSQTWRINWRHTDWFHAAHYPEEATIKWFVVLSGGRYPQHAICYHYRQQRWWIEEYPVPVLSSCTGFYDGRNVVYLGMPGRRVGMAGKSTVDGVSDKTTLTLRGTVTGSGLTSLADSSANWSSSLIGLNVRIVSGRGRGQSRIIHAVSGTTLRVVDPWTTKPDTTSVYQIGGIEWRWRSGWFRWTPSQAGEEARRAFDVVFQPTTAESALSLVSHKNLVATPEDQALTTDVNGVRTTDGEPEVEIDTTQTEGHIRHVVTDHRDVKAYGKEKVRVSLEGVANAERQRVLDVVVEGAS